MPQVDIKKFNIAHLFTVFSGQHACMPLSSVCVNVKPPEFYRCDCREGYAVPDTALSSGFNLGGTGCQDFDECAQSGKDSRT